MASYIALLHKEAKSDYGVSFPDFPGCVTAGRTLEEARRFAPEALELHIRGIQEDGELIPEPSSLDAVMEDPDHQDAVAFLVDAKVERSKAVRVNVTIKEDVLDMMDALAASLKTTRSGMLEQAVVAFRRPAIPRSVSVVRPTRRKKASVRKAVPMKSGKKMVSKSAASGGRKKAVGRKKLAAARKVR